MMKMRSRLRLPVKYRNDFSERVVNYPEDVMGGRGGPAIVSASVT